MGRVLAGILSAAIERQTSDDRDRDTVLVEAATTASADREQLDGLLEPGTAELPPEATVRALLEAAQVENPDQAITDARADGDVFEGDEIATGEEVQIAAGGRLVEAVGK